MITNFSSREQNIKILVITSNFGQDGVPSSHHITDRLMELIQYNVDVTVVTEDKQPFILNSELVGRLKILRIGTRRNSLKRLLPKQFARSISFFSNALSRISRIQKDKFGDWKWEAAATRCVLKEINSANYDLIYSTGGPAVAHLVAYNAIRVKKINWIAEIQDPLIFEEIQISYKATQNDINRLMLAEFALEKADMILCLTKECAEHYRKKLNKKEVTYIYPGSRIHKLADVSLLMKEAIKERKCSDSDKIVFFHAGTLTGDRNLCVFIKAVLALGIQDKIKLILTGHIGNEIEEMIRPYDFIDFIGRISRENVVEYIICSDVCLVIQNVGPVSKLTIPSKFYDYIAIRSPTMFLGYNNREMELASKQYNFYYADQSSMQGVIETLDLIIKERDGLKRPLPIHIEKSTEKFLELCKDFFIA